METSKSKLYTEVIAVYCEINTEHINTLWGQNVELLMLNPVVYKISCRP